MADTRACASAYLHRQDTCDHAGFPLHLQPIPHSGYFSPDAIVTALSKLTNLKEFWLKFQFLNLERNLIYNWLNLTWGEVRSWMTSFGCVTPFLYL